MKKAKKLLKILSKEKKVYIQPHNFPDPDSIGSAFGLCEMLKYKGIDATIIYHGELQRSIMVTMINDMSIDINRVDEPILNSSDKIIVVDCSPSNSNVMPIGGTIVGVIDHHEFISDTKYKFVDIRPRIGATSSIIASYYFELGITPSKNVATALSVGLNIDTSYLTRKVAKIDIDMYSKLIDYVDIDMMRFIIINNLEIKDLNYIREALDNYKIYKNFLYANLGQNLESNFTGIMSDFFLSIKEIDFVVIYTETQTGIILSVRNLNSNWNAAQITQKALEGVGTGGGHKHMAGGFIKFSEDKKTNIQIDLFEKFKKVLFPDNND